MIPSNTTIIRNDFMNSSFYPVGGIASPRRYNETLQNILSLIRRFRADRSVSWLTFEVAVVELSHEHDN
jgi:hypothetical protein